MSDALFDITPYGGPPKAQQIKTVAPPPDSIAVSGEKWNGVSSKTPGLVHYVIGREVVKRRTGDVAAIVAACGLVVTPHTYDPDEVRQGCVACHQRAPS